MPEYVTAQHQITFKTGLPLGQHATFTQDNQLWIAVPADKYHAITGVTDRLIGALAHIRDELVSWLCGHPEDTVRVTRLLAIISSAYEYEKQAKADKNKARTA